MSFELQSLRNTWEVEGHQQEARPLSKNEISDRANPILRKGKTTAGGANKKIRRERQKTQMAKKRQRSKQQPVGHEGAQEGGEREIERPSRPNQGEYNQGGGIPREERRRKTRKETWSWLSLTPLQRSNSTPLILQDSQVYSTMECEKSCVVILASQLDPVSRKTMTTLGITQFMSRLETVVKTCFCHVILPARHGTMTLPTNPWMAPMQVFRASDKITPSWREPGMDLATWYKIPNVERTTVSTHQSNHSNHLFLSRVAVHFFFCFSCAILSAS